MRRSTPIFVAALLVILIAPPASANLGSCQDTPPGAYYTFKLKTEAAGSSHAGFLDGYGQINDPCTFAIFFGVEFSNGHSWTIVVLPGVHRAQITLDDLRDIGLDTRPRVVGGQSGWPPPQCADAILGVDGVLRSNPTTVC